ncbi:MAG: LysM peptidoglycan-binding domain-containing protein [Acidobacteria bacterium]|nr:LysM peptidoglycan-binding domain-containing protein [Acidobacteriota bacterium]
MKNTIRIMFGVLFLLCGLIWCIAQESGAQVPEQGPPLPNLVKQADGHWSPYQAPSYGEGAKIHTVQTGDTLWDLARQYLQTPYLWPQIWEKNPYIHNPHWIYPGDPILIEEPKLVDEPRIETPEAVQEEEFPPAQESLKAFPRKTRRRQIITYDQREIDLYYATEAELYGSGRLLSQPITFDMFVVGAENEDQEINLGLGDIIYINRGMRNDVYPGNRYQVLRPIGQVVNPITDKQVGYFYQELGTVQVLIAHDDNAIAEIDFSTDMIYVGDGLVSFVEKTKIRRDTDHKFQRFVGDNGKPTGNVVYMLDKQSIAGAGEVVFIDLGANANLAPGQFCSVYQVLGPHEKGGEFYSSYKTATLDPQLDPNFIKNRDQALETRNIPRVIAGELVVLEVFGNAAKAVVIQSRKPIELGDYVQIQ